MADVRISPPENFAFTRPEEWSKWIRRFERFRNASGLAEKEQPTQIHTLVYTMGDEAEDILTSFRLTEEQGKTYATVVERFHRHFVKRRNLIFERAKFNRRKQEEGELVDDFIMDLYRLAEHCSYGELHDELIRDRIVVGLRCAALSEKLQRDADLTLEKVVQMAREDETIKKEQALLRSDFQEDKAAGRSNSELDFVRRKPPGKEEDLQVLPHHPTSHRHKGDRAGVPGVGTPLLMGGSSALQGITKCRERAKHSVWWPGLSRQLEETVKSCRECAKNTPLRPEPLPLTVTTVTVAKDWNRFVRMEQVNISTSRGLLLTMDRDRQVEINNITGSDQPHSWYLRKTRDSRDSRQ